MPSALALASFREPADLGSWTPFQSFDPQRPSTMPSLDRSLDLDLDLRPLPDLSLDLDLDLRPLDSSLDLVVNSIGY